MEVGESVHHALHGCYFSRSVWSLLKGATFVGDLNMTLNCSWLEFFDYRSSKDLLAEALYLAWALWNNKNSCFFNSICKTASFIYNSSISLAVDYRFDQSKLVSPPTRVAAVWTAPIIGWYKSNVDASFIKAEAKAWVDAILRCYRGEIVLCCKQNYWLFSLV